MGMAGGITSSSSSELLTTLRNRLVPFGGLRALGERASGGRELAGAFLTFGLCISLLREFSIKDAVESSKSSPDL